MEGPSGGDATSRRYRGDPANSLVTGAAAVAAILAVGLLTGCTGSDDSAADPDAEGVDGQEVIGVGAAAVGKCLAVRDDVGPTVTDLPTIACDSGSASHEIIGVFDASADVYPGQEELEETAQRECLDAYGSYVGGSVFGSDYFVSWMIPTLDSWNQANDREIICVAARIDNEPLADSLEGVGSS